MPESESGSMSATVIPISCRPAEVPATLERVATITLVDLWWVTIATTVIPLSLIWDFSWESTIGVDRLWSPPHLATNIGIWLSAVLAARLIFRFTIAGRQTGIVAGVRPGPFCGPSGAWVLLWAAGLLQLCLFLDAWWQQAYGLGAGFWPPPQIIKTAGFFTLIFGGVMLCASARNNNLRNEKMADRFLAWHGGLLLSLCVLILIMSNYSNLQHTASFYLVSCAIYPAVLMALSHSARSRWRTARTAMAYMVLTAAMVWLLPLCPAHPLAAPIHNATGHLMPPPFPLLLIVPALCMDYIGIRFKPMRSIQSGIGLAIASGTIFLCVFLAAQWLFSVFLLSSAADNWFFAGGGRHWPFYLKIDQARVMFWGLQQDPLTWAKIVAAGGLAIISSWIGLQISDWVSRLCR
jgi:uncharacterized integral membrane protein